MIVLGLDTATRESSVALVELDGDGGPRVLAARSQGSDAHGDVLVALIDELVAEAGLTPAAVGAIAVGAGPGSFTGLRIGLATGKGLAFALGTPLWLASSLAALAVGAGVDGLVAQLSSTYVAASRGCRPLPGRRGRARGRGG
ncbi:MAG: tRNA (adenosine(37)-N6)-threonylcarbamoyltransferase complex dimerization subunit type 1 TsaB [Kofleriaceae bacterium]